MKTAIEENDRVAKQKSHGLASNTNSAVQGLLEHDTVLLRAAPGLGTDQEFLKKVVEQVHEPFGSKLATGRSEAEEQLRVLDPKLQTMADELSRARAATAATTQALNAQGSVGASPALDSSYCP